MNILLILILSILLMIITFILSTIYNNYTKTTTNYIKKPSSGNGDFKCPISDDPKLLKQCNPQDQNSCNQCQDGLHSCFTIDDNNKYKSSINVPNGNWCLPTSVVDLPCNQYSGTSTLTKFIDNEYAWKCHCKYPNLFINKGEFGDCVSQVACGGEENPLICPTDATFCTPGEKWIDNPTWNPEQAVCKCANGTKYVNYDRNGVQIKECVNDSCYPNGKINNDNNSCICNEKTGNVGSYKSFINCPTELPDNQKNLCDENNPECIDDPCNPYGYWDVNSLTCKCADGYVSAPDSNSPTKTKCFNPCDDINNPCGSRGDCYYDKTNNKTLCNNCKKPWVQDDSRLCLKTLKPQGASCTNSNECSSGTCQIQSLFNWSSICR